LYGWCLLMFHLTYLEEQSLCRYSLLIEEQPVVIRDYLELCLVECDDFILPLISSVLSGYWNSPEHVWRK
jgi:hypothetical protein